MKLFLFPDDRLTVADYPTDCSFACSFEGSRGPWNKVRVISVYKKKCSAGGTPGTWAVDETPVAIELREGVSPSNSFVSRESGSSVRANAVRGYVVDIFGGGSSAVGSWTKINEIKGDVVIRVRFLDPSTLVRLQSKTGDSYDTSVTGDFGYMSIGLEFGYDKQSRD